MRPALLVSALLASGCATIVTGTHDTVHLTSTPPGVMVEIQGNVITTPAHVVVSRSLFGSDEARATLEGYRERRFRIGRELNMWTLANVLNLFLGVPVDVLSGAALKYPDRYGFRMYPVDGPITEPEGGF